ncbi:GlxA family transcriptional regulator [Streptomyces qinzhouensis]|uniref:Helix-turn-helix domain-containing protein n=1 Tax=Streptomyces qinzhouensis TaxID=2599401 RepID=A0A5B8JF71_9ACTN|nr:helix-turn-helix domain-containing protein [Streptomyces qinzhouensis]QDY80116.1 helix-turn-helix domain-containing protein [Streptomyces qinzhouensis]
MPVVALLVADGVPGHQLTAPATVLDAAAAGPGPAAYELRICAIAPAVTTAGPVPLGITATHGLDGLADAATVVVAGQDGVPGDPPPEVAAAVRAAAARGAGIAAVGTGAFTLAATGLLDGRRATTEWCHIPELARRHPRVTVDPGGTPVTDGPFLTASGVLGGLDLFLRLVEYDHGPSAAARTARQLIAPVYAHAGATRAEIDREIAGTAGLEPTLRWLAENLHRPLPLDSIAAHARMSVRSLNRRFHEQTGFTPLQYLLRARVERARELLADGEGTVEEIAARTGFGSAAGFRRHFRRLTGTAPAAVRGTGRPAQDRHA